MSTTYWVSVEFNVAIGLVVAGKKMPLLRVIWNSVRHTRISRASGPVSGRTGSMELKFNQFSVVWLDSASNCAEMIKGV